VSVRLVVFVCAKTRCALPKAVVNDPKLKEDLNHRVTENTERKIGDGKSKTMLPTSIDFPKAAVNDPKLKEDLNHRVTENTERKIGDGKSKTMLPTSIDFLEFFSLKLFSLLNSSLCPL
jgi:hypothetical protein